MSRPRPIENVRRSSGLDLRAADVPCKRCGSFRAPVNLPFRQFTRRERVVERVCPACKLTRFVKQVKRRGRWVDGPPTAGV